MHLGIIMDGNRRWAKKNLKKTILGHHGGKENLKKILPLCLKHGIKILTIYALSTENLTRRSPLEVKSLLSLIEKTINEDYENFVFQGYGIKILGKTDNLPKKIATRFEEIQNLTNLKKPKLLLQACINYGGRDEIVRSVNKIIDQGDVVNEKSIGENLDSSLEPDLIIRTGGDFRISNFLLWQGAYSELYFTPVLWPDFGEKELLDALKYFKQTKRNFGK
jgi:undecaprenyl diphosphate synthase